MFHVVTVFLTPDARRADAALEPSEHRKMAREDLFVLLEQFRQISPVENLEAEPSINITGPGGKFIVRTGLGKLYVYNARDPSAPYAELTTSEFIAQLERAPASPPSAVEGEEPTAQPPAKTPSRGIAAAILAAGLALNGYTLYSVSYVESVNPRLDVTLIVDPAERKMRQNDVVGTYATGNQPGDRIIVITADEQVAFSELGARKREMEGRATYRLGRRAGKLCLATASSGIIEVRDIDTIVYYRDTYRRTK